MPSIPRRDFLYLGLAASAGLASGATIRVPGADIHRQLLGLALEQQERRRARFAAVSTPAELASLQASLREAFLGRLLGGLPERAGPPPPARVLGRVDGGDYFAEKLVFESFPGYFVSALLYRPKGLDAPAPGILGPCGHSADGKAAPTYQALHVNLARRGYVVLTYDPVGQGERSQFWDAGRGRSRFNLVCGEHCVLGNPLYLLGTNLARFRIWDGLRALDYLESRPEVDASRIGCVGNSGGGNLTAYLAAIDPRVRVPVIGCYITSLPRRMGNRIEADPDSDPEQDLFGFVGEGIDHAGLLALMVPRPTLLCTARFDFFPIEGARETFAEARRLHKLAGDAGRIDRVESQEKHGLSRPLREAAYAWFDQWLAGRAAGDVRREELAVEPRAPKELHVCPEGQVGLSFRSRPLLPMALEEFRARPRRPRARLVDLLRLDPDSAGFHLTEEAAGAGRGPTLLLCVNGVESGDWRQERAFLAPLAASGLAVSVVDPRGVGRLRPPLEVRGQAYDDPLSGVEENLAYNAFLVGKALLGMRVADVLAAVAEVAAKAKPGRLVLCARRDAALVACMAAAVSPGIGGLAVQEMPLSLLPLFEADGRPINAASILPGLLRDFGDIPDVLDEVAPRGVLVAAPLHQTDRRWPSVRLVDRPFTADPNLLIDWLRA